MSHLLDTMVISELMRPAPSQKVLQWFEGRDERTLFLSALTLGEVAKGVARLADGRRRRTLEVWLEGDLPARFEGRLLPVDGRVARNWGTLASLRAAAGRPLPVIDGLIAATCAVHGLTLVTRNRRDFEGLNLAIEDPWE